MERRRGKLRIGMVDIYLCLVQSASEYQQKLQDTPENYTNFIRLLSRKGQSCGNRADFSSFEIHKISLAS
jgi:hypothetical protein